MQPLPTRKEAVHKTQQKISLHVVDESFAGGKCMYFVKTQPVAVPKPAASGEIHAIMMQHFEFGVLSKSTLQSLANVIDNIYWSMLSKPSTNAASARAPKPSKGMRTERTTHILINDSVRSEFLGNMKRFSSEVALAQKQISGEIRFRMPTISIDNPKAAAEDYQLMCQIEAAVEEWTPMISNILESQEQFPKGQGALAEVAFWNDRRTSLSSVYEQLNNALVRKMLEVLEYADSPNALPFRVQYNDLSKKYLLAEENVKFLTTLERHLKNLQTGTIQSITDTLPSMLDAVKMVWIISRHYSKDENMTPLMERIAWEIRNQVSKVINIQTILQEPKKKPKIQNCKSLLEKWKSTYLERRSKIEEGGGELRWEFDRRRLFEQTDYMAERCGNLLEIAQVIEEFHNIPMLRAVTGNSPKIEDVLCEVNDLEHAVESITFDIFDKRYQTSWETEMKKFLHKSREIDTTLKEVITESFSHLHSAEAAFDLLQNYKTIQTRPAINKLMSVKFTDVLKRFSDEIEKVHETFRKHKDKPPLPKNQPIVSGNILWSQTLFEPLKKTITRFQSLDNNELLDSVLGKYVKNQYLKLGKAMRTYEQSIFKEWASQVDSIASSRLKAPILQEEGGAFRINFSPDITAIIKDAKALDYMGFSVPQTALNITLQEEKYCKLQDDLETMLRGYYNVQANVARPEEEVLLKAQNEHIREFFRPGIEVLNWNSLGIPDYIKKCSQEVNSFQAVLNSIHINVAKMSSVVEDIANARLVARPTPLPGEEVLELQEFYTQQEKNRTSVVQELVKKYRSVTNCLGQIESVTVPGKPTFQCEHMKPYYDFWERKIFNALNKMVLENLAAMQQFTSTVTSKNKSERFPLFRIVASLVPPEISVRPSLEEVHKYFSMVLNGIVNCPQYFVRWENGRCTECQPQVFNPEEEPVIISFLPAISANPQVIKTMFQVTQSVQRTLGNIERYLNGWTRYRVLWSIDREIAMEKYAQKDSSSVEFDEKLAMYTKLSHEVQNLPLEKDVDFIRAISTPLSTAVQGEVAAWIFSYGKLLNDSARKRLMALNGTINRLEMDLQRTPETMEDLKFVLTVIEQIWSQTMVIESQYDDVSERYRTLDLYGFPTPQEELDLVSKLVGRWNELLVRAKTVDEGLIFVKARFTETTKRQVELFQKKVANVKRKFASEGPSATDITLDVGLERLEKFRKTIQRYLLIREELVLAEKLFSLPITSYPDLSSLECSVKGLNAVFELYVNFKQAITQWSSTLWSALDINALVGGVESFVNKLQRLPKEVHGTNPFHLLQEKIFSFRDSIPLIRDLKSEALRPRHWQKLLEITGQTFQQQNNQGFTLEAVFAMELSKYADQIAEITSGANHELTFENSLQDIANTWKSIRFEVVKYTRGTEDRGYILKGIDDVQALYEDNQMTLQAMAVSRYAAFFMDNVQKWEKRIALIEEVCQEWMLVQKKWLYLENIFIGNEDIRVRLPEEAKRFARIDKTFKKLMADTAKNTLVLQACSEAGRAELLKSLHQQLQACQHALSEYLETKRQAFARFYFLSDDELLSILGSSDIQALQIHMIKLFDNVQSLRFGGSTATGQASKWVVGMCSSEGEVVDFRQQVAAEGSVEVWMSSIEAEMKATLRAIAKETVLQHVSLTFQNWLESFPAMCIFVVTQIWWTWDVEDTFRKLAGGDKYALKKLSKAMHDKLDFLVGMVRGELAENLRVIVNTLIIIEIHQCDVVDSFVRDSVLSADHFDWESQLRFYWDQAQDDILIRQCDGVFNYGYEYMGLSGRLVITPLTVRCIITLTQALSHRLGGAPAGPAGTGKTETVKDLAKTLGLLCKVHNCGEGVDYSTMGRLLSGLVQCGGWGCFDEFNRIRPEVLSVISVQVSTIQHAMRSSQKKFQFFGKELNLDFRYGIFVTANPNYAGRTELPENLKALFRPVVMVVPDMELIAEVILFSQGFTTARVLAKKICVLYEFSKQQLSKQNHYDWGLRALKSVLTMAGALKRSSHNQPEDTLVIKAVRGMNLPKLVFADLAIFRGMLQDLFPGVSPPPDIHKKLLEKIEEGLTANEYKIVPEQVNKIIQLHETMMTRHCVMVVGPTQSGKTVIINALQAAQKAMGFPTKLLVLNPKAQGVKELYGSLDVNTRQWSNGLLSNLFREANSPQKKDKKTFKYIILDGDVDPEWVEDMNSVMDDSKQLTLPNGECIRMQPYCSLIFEVRNLEFASPATVSRCGMVYVPAQTLSTDAYFDKWLKRQHKQDQKALSMLFEKYVPQVLNYVTEGVQRDGTVGKKPTSCIPICATHLVKQLCALLFILLSKREMNPEKEVIDPRLTECFFIFSLVWSLGACLMEESREAFDHFVKSLSGWPVLNTSDPCGAGTLPGELPTLFEYYFDDKDNRWVPWSEHIEPFNPTPTTKFHQMLVSTSDTVINTWLLDSFVQITKQPVLFVGESGTAKTVIIQTYLSKLNPDQYTLLTINMSSRTSSLDAQRTLEYSTERRGAGVFGPPMGKTLVVFIDDLNMPLVDKYGTQQPIALLKMLLERGGVYDRGGELNWISFRSVQFVAAMGMPGGGRSSVDPRLLSLFNVVYIPSPSHANLHKIYASILTRHLEPFHDGIKEAGAKMTETTLRLYNHVLATLPPTPAKFHYIFNLRDLGRIYEGLCLSTLDKFDTTQQFVRLWRNECMRVFCDRIVAEADRKNVTDKLQELITEVFPEELAHAVVEPSLFGDFRHVASPSGEEIRIYEDLGDFNDVKAIFEEIIMNFNERNIGNRSKNIDLVLFDYTLEHLTRILRIIRRPRSNALLVGMSGSGKRTLARLAAFAAGYNVFEITITKNYGEEQFRENLKDLFRQLGLENRELVFLFSDEHVVKEEFLESINNMLTSGMVPALFAEDEKEQIIKAMREEVSKLRIFDSRENCWDFFINRCRDNLHVVLCMSPAGDMLRKRCRSFPGLVNNTSIDWFQQWPEIALLSVASAQLAHLPDEFRNAIAEHMVFVHSSALKYAGRFEQQLRRSVYITPKNFLDYVHIYLDLIKQNYKSIDDQVKRLGGGLKKLTDAGTHLEELNSKLQVQKAQVDEQAKLCNELLQSIGEKKSNVESAQLLAQQKERELQELSQQIVLKKAEAEHDLEEAQPELEKAHEALLNLKKDEITEIRTFTLPPKPVQSVCECICWLKGAKEISWKSAKGMMASPNFLSELIQINADDLSEKQIRGVREIIRKSELSIPAMQAVSSAATGLLTWVEAILNYFAVAKKVKPKKAAVEAFQKQQNQNQKDLENIVARTKDLMTQIEALNKDYQARTSEQRRLANDAELMEKRLLAAKQLISGLGTERIRWTRDIEGLDDKKRHVIGDCLLCAPFLGYAGPFNFDYRAEMAYSVWQDDIITRQIPLSFPFKLENVLIDDVKKNQWVSEDLPPDEFSIQNGMLTVSSPRYPLCIDPQMQANQWIKKKEAKEKLVVCTLTDPDFSKRLELAVTLGLPMLIEGIGETVDPLLDPILNKNVIVNGTQKTLKLGEKDIDFNDKFRLYMTTKLANPNFDPNLFVKVSVINYNVTLQGLQDQLLSMVVAYEHPDLESQREELVRTQHENQKQLKICEDSLLEELVRSEGSMLDNQELIATLEETKKKAIDIFEKLEILKKTMSELEKTRTGYVPAAKRGALLFFVLTSLSSVNTMYQYSLKAYTEIFKASLAQSAQLTTTTPAIQTKGSDSPLQLRLNSIISTLTQKVYDWTCMGLFEKDKLTFSFQMTIDIKKVEGQIDLRHLDFFLRGNTALEKSKRKSLLWMNEQAYRDLVFLGTLPDFSDIDKRVEERESEWQQWASFERPEEERPPLTDEQWETMRAGQEKLGIHLLLLMRVFRPDRVWASVRNYVANEMGEKYVQPSVVLYQSIFDQSNPIIPVICVLSPGADPLYDITKLAEKLGFGGNRLKPFALGQDQGDPAAQLVENGVSRGQWIVLQNCHLLPSWLPALEKILEQIDKPNKDFRLWLTTEPTPKFPVGILQRSLKVVTEPPNGLKMNMRASFSKISEETLVKCPHALFRPLVYVLAFFHAVVQERRKYGAIGWNVAYDFNESDFNVSLAILATQLTKFANMHQASNVPSWGSLRYLIGEVMYGGRVTDSYDRRVLSTYLEEYMGDFLFDTFQPFHFYNRNGISYTIPSETTLEAFVSSVDALPAVNSPDVFGLNHNAEIGYFANTAKEMWASLIEMQPRTGEVAGGTRRDAIVSQIASNVLTHIPAPFNVIAIEKALRAAKPAESPDLTPAEVVLLQELEHWNRLVNCMKQSIAKLQKALLGELAMDYELESLFHYLFIGAIPASWRALAPATQKSLADWLVHFKQRYNQYKTWVKSEPTVMWLSGLHVPEAYLTSLVQTASRKMSWPLDKTVLITKITNTIDPAMLTERPEIGCYIHGLYLEGAAWDLENGHLESQKPRVLVYEMPVIQLVPVEVHKRKQQGVLPVPVYVTQARRNKSGEGFVFEADLPTKEHPSHWVLQGVSLTLNVA
eukprot:TRINITY_DN3695_c0_g1_i1.p1 TRINITY_DN3695_c0_g1~~TRINITY_DN3695_c0_g1_i1.p1  ORF type:complete len:4489 (-),score=1285.68 TRINITY_DN3695_c0_g1_i1:87-13553(-)